MTQHDSGTLVRELTELELQKPDSSQKKNTSSEENVAQSDDKPKDRAAKLVVLVVGGRDDGGDTWLYHVADNRWEEVPACAMFLTSMCLTAEGRVLAAGGSKAGSEAVTAQCQVFDAREKTWQPWPSMTSPRLCHVLVRQGDMYLAVGGWYGTNSSELYDPARGCWRPVPGELPVSFLYARAVKLRRDTWAFFDTTMGSDKEAVMEFSFATEQWTRLEGGLDVLPTSIPYVKLLTSVMVSRPSAFDCSTDRTDKEGAASDRQLKNIVSVPEVASFDSTLQLSNSDVIAAKDDLVYVFSCKDAQWTILQDIPPRHLDSSLVEVIFNNT